MPHDILANQLKSWLDEYHPDSQLLCLTDLDGGTATQMLAFEFAKIDGTTQTLILRQPNEHDLVRDPDAALHEYRLLRQLNHTGLCVPDAHFVDQGCAYFNTPTLILNYLPGNVVYQPPDRTSFALQTANYLSRLHQVDVTSLDITFLPEVNNLYGQRLHQSPNALDEDLMEGWVRDILSNAWPIPCPNRPCLLHGDYWLGNFLWENEDLVAVIDWENAMIGDPLADLATSRLEMLWMFDLDMMTMFTHAYLLANPIDTTTLPWWELSTVLRSAFHISEWAEPEKIKDLREKQLWFFTQALEKLRISF